MSQSPTAPASAPVPATKPPASDDFAAIFAEHVRAGYSCLYIPTTEESRVETVITDVVSQLKWGGSGNRKWKVITWDVGTGLSSHPGPDGLKYRLPAAALDLLAEPEAFGADSRVPHICIFRDLDDYFNDQAVRRRVRGLCESGTLAKSGSQRLLVILSPSAEIHPKLRSHMSMLDFSLPGEAALGKIVDRLNHELVTAAREQRTTCVECTPELRSQIVRCLRGLTGVEAANCVARCLIRHRGFVEAMLSDIKDEKASIIKKSETLTYIPESQQADVQEIGGFANFLNWLSMRRKAYSERARAIKIDYPRGVFLLGPPGTGKSLVGLAAGKLMGLPVYIFDVSAVFGKMVGESEQRMRDAIKQIEAQQGCVLLIDEADKALGNATSSQGDSGVTMRVFGTLLTWLASKQSPTFAIMTANSVAGLPPELLRAGRFDEVFYTTLPTPTEARQILEIHLRKRAVDPAALGFTEADWAAIVEKMSEFVGSEIEEVVKSARYRSFAERDSGVPSFEDLVEAAAGVTSMASRDREQLKKIVDYCAGKGRPVHNDLTVPNETRRSLSM